MRAWLASALLMLLVGASATLATPATAREGGWDGRRWSDRTYSEYSERQYRRERRASRYDDEDEARPRRRYRYDGDRSERPRYLKRRHTKTAKHYRRGAKVAQRRAASRRIAKARKRPAVRQAVRPSPQKPASRVARGGGSGQNGVASFYWQPQRVASGGWFNPNAMTAAHRSLPFGTRVRVTHQGTGRSVDVKINDRGPYIAGRIIDLSKAAAGVIGMTAQGIARVTVEILGR